MLRNKGFVPKFINIDQVPEANDVASVLGKSLVADPDDLTIAGQIDNAATVVAVDEAGSSVTHNIVANTRDSKTMF